MKKIILLFCASIFLASCTDFLDEEPRTERDQDQYFTDPSHAYSAVNQLYRSGIQQLHNAGSAYNGPKVMSGGYMSGFWDNPRYKGQEQFIIECQNLAINPQTSGNYLDDVWDYCYEAISRANLAILRIPSTPGLSGTERNNLLAEAYFFRAYNYFMLLKYFGDVPLILEPYNSLDGLYVARTPSSQVYQQIITDLTFASEKGELKEAPMPANGFRISKGSVNTLLADVYLTMSGFPVKADNYANAAKVARQIIGTGSYGLIQNQNNTDRSAYSIMRTSENEREYMYSVEYKANIAESFWMPVYCYPSGAVNWPGNIFTYSITTEVYLPNEEFLSIYDPVNDIRIQEKQFFHSSLTYNYTDGNGVQQTNTERFPTMPYLWEDATALFQTGRPDRDFVAYRYAEVLLIAAEAIAMSEGVNSEAIGYLADVRSRALMNKSREDVIADLSGLSKDAFVEEVWKERLREFAVEFKIWDDMKRTRKIMSADKNNKGNVTFKDLIGSQNSWGKTYQEKDMLYPISANELQRNPALEQNKGY